MQEDKSLLEIVKSIKISRNGHSYLVVAPTPSQVEIGLAWLKEEVQSGQVIDACDFVLNGNPYAKLHSELLKWLKEAYKQGKLIIKN